MCEETEMEGEPGSPAARRSRKEYDKFWKDYAEALIQPQGSWRSSIFFHRWQATGMV